jgi:hypothetical protein
MQEDVQFKNQTNSECKQECLNNKKCYTFQSFDQSPKYFPDGRDCNLYYKKTLDSDFTTKRENTDESEWSNMEKI